MLTAGRARPRLAAAALLVFLACPAGAQFDFNDEPLLASAISSQDVRMRGRWVRQWRDAEGVLVLMFNGGFQLDMGQRRLAANNAVVWIEPRREAESGRVYHELTVYLSENAEVREPAGTLTQDTVLLVRGLRTFGRIVKQHDAYAPENMEHSPLYLQALRDRLLLEEAEAAPPAAGEVARPEQMRPAAARPPRVIRYSLPNIEPATTPEGEPVFVSTGGVYFSQGGGPDAAMLEIRARSAVVFPAEGAAESLFGEQGSGAAKAAEEQPAPAEPSPEPSAPQPDGATSEAAAALGLGGPQAEGRVRAVYLEGDVVLSLGTRFVRADRLYYDFEHDRALILDGVFRADVPARGIPLYVRAAEIRQLSAREFAADRAVVTTSEFYTPHYHVGAERVYVRDLTRRDAEGRASGPASGTYELRNSTLNIGGVPVAWWPYSQGRLDSSETLLRRIRTGYSGQFGYELESAWYLFNLLGIAAPPGVDAALLLDYFSRRGPAVGINVDYEQEQYYGLLRSYLIYDQGEDSLGPLRERYEEPSTSTRGRALWRHRHYLPYDWELTLEGAYASDAYFLEEYFEDEWFEGKEQETVIYLKRAKGVQALTLLANWRTLDFVTQTEHLPELAYRRIGDTLGPVVLYHESRVGDVRRALDNRNTIRRPEYGNWGETDVTFRTDVRQEAELPLKLGPVTAVPFGSLRGSYWDGQPLDAGGLWRGLGAYGVRGGTTLARVFDEVDNRLLDIHRIRHVIQPEYTVWGGHSNVRSSELSPFDYGVETLDEFYGFSVGVRQTWQTKRGIGELQRTVDLLTLNLQLGAFGDTEGRNDRSDGYVNPYRPENSRVRNYFSGDLVYRISDSTSLLYDFNIDMNDGSYDQNNIAIAVERSPRLAYVLGARYAGDIDMSLIGGGWNYRLSDKHLTAFRSWFDVDTGELGEITIGYVRRLPRWYASVAFEYDNVEQDCSVTFSIWPEGVPEWALGSKRFSGLATGTGIRP